MKRLLPVLAALILAALFPSLALAAEENESVTIVIGEAAAQSGEKTDIAVYLEHSAGVDSIQFDLNYDPAALSVVSVTPGDLFLPEYVVYNADEPGRIRIACADALGLKGDGTLLTIRFAALSDTGSALIATSGIITRVDADYNQTVAYVSLEDGGVSVAQGAVPAALVTPWIPETPVPSPTPTPSPTPAPTMEALAQSSAEDQQETSPTQIAEPVDPIAYIVVAALVVLLILLITVSVVRRRRQAVADALSNHPVRKDT